MNQHAPPVRRPATYQDVLDAPENMVAELIEGALHLHPRPAAAARPPSSSLGDEIGVTVRQGARTGPAAGGFSTSRSCISPRTSSCRTWPDGGASGCPDLPQTAWFEVPPDWVCEVLSPGTRRST